MVIMRLVYIESSKKKKTSVYEESVLEYENSIKELAKSGEW